MIEPDGKGGCIYQIEASALSAKDDGGLRRQMLAIIEPIAGASAILKYETVKDKSGHALTYKVWVEKE